MASAHCLASGHIVGVAQAHGRDKVIATIEGDGVTQYDLNTKVSNGLPMFTHHYKHACTNQNVLQFYMKTN